MNIKNYIHPLPPKEQRSLFMWYTISAYIVVGCITLLVIASGYHYFLVKTKEREHQALIVELHTLQQQTQPIEQIKKEVSDTQKKITKIKNIQQTPFSPVQYIRSIAQAMPDDMYLTEITYAKDGNIVLKGFASAAESVFAYHESLQKLLSQQLHINSLSPHKTTNSTITWFQFILQGTSNRKANLQ